MRPEKYLFILSLLFFFGCTTESAKEPDCSKQIETLNAVHLQAIDSLQSVIESQQKLIEEMESVKEVKGVSDPEPEKTNQLEIPKTKPEGFPTKVPEK